MNFPFSDAPNTATVLCSHIMSGDKPILYVSHDEEDGMWQFLCGNAHNVDEAKVVYVQEVFELDNSLYQNNRSLPNTYFIL